MICATTWLGETKLTLWQPSSCSASIMSAISAGSVSWPMPFWEMSQFWQNTQRRLHQLKKIVPDPREPRSGSSSPWWGP
jgi:hypothetical protein